MTILEAARLLAARKVSSLVLAEEALAAIARRNPELNAFITVTGDHARAQALERDAELARGMCRGPLHGIPMALKDVFCTRGIRTTCGSKLFENYVPGHDAAVAEKLEAAGAVLVGKTGLHELAYGVTSNNPHFGPVRNPHDPSRIPGGSSGGSGAAVAAGMAMFAMGSDTGGSIRIPASYCGVVGLKPTTGRVSRYGVMPLNFTQDHMGPLTQTVRDAAIVLQALAGYDARDESSSRLPVGEYAVPEQPSIGGLRIGIPENFYYERLDAEVEAAVQGLARGAEKMGARLIPVRVPDMASINTVGRIILLAEAAAVMAPYADRRGDFGADVLALLDQGKLIPAADYVNAQRLRRQYRREFAQVWEKADCLLAPATPVTAPRIGQSEVDAGGTSEDVRLASTRLLRPANVIGFPSLAVPCGTSRAGLPLGAQWIGRPFDEATLLRVAACSEKRDRLGDQGH